MSDKRSDMASRPMVPNFKVPRLANGYRNASGERIGLPAPPQMDFDSEIISNLPPIQHTGGRSGFFQFMADQGAAPDLDDGPMQGGDDDCYACKGTGKEPRGADCQSCGGTGTYVRPPENEWYDNKPENQPDPEFYRQMLTGRRRQAGFNYNPGDKVMFKNPSTGQEEPATVVEQDPNDGGVKIQFEDGEQVWSGEGEFRSMGRRQAYKNPTYIPPAAEERFSVTDRYDDRGTPGMGDAMEDKYQHDPKRAAARGRADILIARAEQAARAGRPEMADRLIAEAEACMNGHNGIMARPLEAGRRVSAVQSHYDWSQEAQKDGRSARPCNANDGNFGGSCFNCGYPGPDALKAQEQVGQSDDSADDDATVESAFTGYDDDEAAAPPKPPKAPKPPEGYAGRRQAAAQPNYADVPTGYSAYGSGADDALDFGD